MLVLEPGKLWMLVRIRDFRCQIPCPHVLLEKLHVVSIVACKSLCMLLEFLQNNWVILCGFHGRAELLLELVELQVLLYLHL